MKVNVPYLLFSNMYLLFVESASRCSKLCWLGGHAEKREMKGGDPPTFFASSPRWRGGGSGTPIEYSYIRVGVVGPGGVANLSGLWD